MPVYDIPMKWDLRTVEKVQAKDPHSAEHWASMNLESPQSNPSTWIVEKRIDGVDFQKMNEMYPIPDPPDPMEGWKCLIKPGPYEGGRWKKEMGDFIVDVIGDDGPIEVGMSFTTYTWRISSDKLPFDIDSKESFHSKEECRDAALKAVEFLKK